MEVLRSMPGFGQMLKGERFHYGVELVSSRGLPPVGEVDKLVEMAENLASLAQVSWISVTDNPGGNPMLPADCLARKVQAAGCEPVVHMSCKDLNRNGLESAAWRCASDGTNSILALTGDYPVGGFGGHAPPVFDLDSVSLITMLKAMNEGLEATTPSGKKRRLAPTDFFVGCAVSPYKRFEREYMPQLFKLARKVQCGADWVIPQLGYDSRKLHELLLFMEWAELEVPVVGNVYLLSGFTARLFHGNSIPGCVVSDALYELASKYAKGPDKGRAFFRELAAKQLAICRGLGCAAGYLAGVATPEVFAAIIDLAESYGEDDWREFAKEICYPREDEFYLFEPDAESGLSRPGQFNPAYLASLEKPQSSKEVTARYRLSRLVHDAAFSPGHGQFARGTKLYDVLEHAEGPVSGVARKALDVVEQVSKRALFGCTECGDCSLPDCAYLCPRQACSKNGRNGPCGGSRDGRCELEDKECMWARAYDRLKAFGESEHLLDGPPVVYNPELAGTSSWANAYLGRDHHHGQGCDDVEPLLPDHDLHPNCKETSCHSRD